MLNRMPFRKQRESDLGLIFTFHPDVWIDERIKKIQSKQTNPQAIQKDDFQFDNKLMAGLSFNYSVNDDKDKGPTVN